MYKNLEQEVMLIVLLQFLWQPIQANPPLQSNCSTRVNDAGLCKADSISILLSNNTFITAYYLFFLITLTAELLDP